MRRLAHPFPYLRTVLGTVLTGAEASADCAISTSGATMRMAWCTNSIEPEVLAQPDFWDS